jgi:predicted LPLAT superfamily acyltransferase
MSVSALFRQFASFFFNYKTLQNKHNIRTLSVFVAYNAKHAELRRKSKDWLLRNQDNVSEWSDMYIHGLLFPLANTIKKKLSVFF